MKLVATTVHAQSPQELDIAEKYLSKIFVKCAGVESLSAVAPIAQRQLQMIQKRKRKQTGENEPTGLASEKTMDDPLSQVDTQP